MTNPLELQSPASGGGLFRPTGTFSARASRLAEPGAALRTQLLAQILEGLGTPAASNSTHGPWSNYLQQNPQANLETAFAALPLTVQQGLRSRIGATNLQELFSISQESNESLFFSSLAQVARRLEQSDRVQDAALVYSAVLQAAPEGLTGIRANVQRDYNAMIGVGSLGPRVEVLARSFARQVTAPEMLVGMAGAQAVFGVARLGFLSRLAASPTSNLITRGFGARAAASSAAFALEAPAFVGIRRGVAEALGQQQDWSRSGVLHELAGTYLTLGALKLSAWGSTAAFNRVHGIHPVTGPASPLSPVSRITQRVLPQVATFGGIYFGHTLETWTGLRPHTDGATTMIDSLAMLAQFGIAGRLMHGSFGPGFERFNRELHVRTEGLGQAPRPSRQSGTFLDALQPSAVTSEGIAMPVPNEGGREAGARAGILMMEGIEPTSGGSPPSVPPPPSDSQPPEARRGRPSFGGRVKRFLLKNVPPLLKTLGRADWNRYVDPNSAPNPLNTGRVPTPLESLEHGVRLAVATGQGESLTRRARRDLTHLQQHGLAETAEAYIKVEQLRRSIQLGERQRVEPLLPLYKNLLEGLESRGISLDGELQRYESITREVLGNKAELLEADALIDVHWARRVASDEAFRNGLTEAELVRMGFDPSSVRRVAENHDTYVPGTIEAILDSHPLLSQHEAAPVLREAARKFYQETLPRLQEARQWVDRVKALEIERSEQNMESTDSATERIRAIDLEIAELNRRINQVHNESGEAANPLKEALDGFLADPVRGRLWLVENARISSIRALIRANPGGFLEQVLSQIGRPAELAEHEWARFFANFSPRYDRFRQASLELGHQRLRLGNLENQGVWDRLRGRRDFQDYWKAAGEYESALLDLLQHHEGQLLGPAHRQLSHHLASMSPTGLERLIEARQVVRTAYWRMGEFANGILTELGPHAQELFRYHDKEYRDLRLEGLRVGMSHVEGLLGIVRQRLGDARFARDIEPEWNKIRQQFQEESDLYLRSANVALRGRINPRDLNRRLEDPVKSLVMRAYGLVEKATERHSWRLRDLKDLPRIVPAFENYTLPFDMVRERSFAERGYKVSRYLIPVLRRMTRIFSAQNHGYPQEIITRNFIDFGTHISRAANPQTFRTPHYQSRISRYFHHSRSDAHWTHLDFIGHSANSVQADAGRMASNISSPDIIAKFDLAIPLIDQVFPLLVNLISNDRAGVRVSEVRAAQMQAFGHLPSRHLHRGDSLNYDTITMPVSTGRSPFVGEANEPVNETWQSIARVFHIAEAAGVLSSRLTGVGLGTDAGAIRNYANQRGPLFLDHNPSNYTNLLLPANAFPEPATSLNSLGNARNSIERAIWYLQAYHPEMNPSSPSTARLYRPFANPRSLAVEAQISRIFAGAEEVFPTVESVRKLEAERNFLRDVVATGEATEHRTTPAAQRDLELVERVLGVQTRRLLRQRLHEIDLEIEAGRRDPVVFPEERGARRLQRVVRARIKLLDQVEKKIAAGETLSLTERRFVERSGAAIAGRENVSGIDRELEQLNYYYQVKRQGGDLQGRFESAQRTYLEFVKNWNERRKDPASTERGQLHVSEADGYHETHAEYRRAVETLLNLHGVTPNRWNGEIMPDMVYRREGDATVIEPRGWQASGELSRGKLWRFLLDDTLGIVRVASRLSRFDPTPNLYLFMHRGGWGYRMANRVQMKLKIENSERLIPVANQAIIVAPTHDSGAEFPTLPAILHDYGIHAFFMADRKFFDPFWGRRTFSILGREFTIPFPQGPTFGFIRALLGDMKQYGHFSIDRGDGRAALQAMKDAGQEINALQRSMIIFPGSTRNPVRFNEQGERYEGQIYGAKPGVALTWEGSRGAILPMGQKRGGVIFPKQAGEAFIKGGALVGSEYVIGVGNPLFSDQVIPGNPRPNGQQLRAFVVPELNRQHHEMTGREVGPPAESKSKKKRR